MAFSVVSWAYRDVITSTKLQQMVDNLKAHDHRPDGSQGAAFKRSGTVAVPAIASGGATVTGSVVFTPAFKAGTTPTVVLGSDRTRHSRAVTAVSATGFDYAVDNWTSANVASGTLVWQADGTPA